MEEFPPTVTSDTTADRSIGATRDFGYNLDNGNVKGNHPDNDQVSARVETRESNGRMMDWGVFVGEYIARAFVFYT